MKPMHKSASLIVVLFAAALSGCGLNEMAARDNLTTRTQAVAPMLLPVGNTASAESAPGNLGSAGSAANGDQLLCEAVAAYPNLAPVVTEIGTPDAVEVNLNRVALYYRNPPRTLVYEEPPFSPNANDVMDLKVVPRSVERLGFQEAPVPGPWPITVTLPQAEILGAPKLPNPPQGEEPASFASKYREQADDLRSKISEVREGEAYDRVNKALARLNPKSSLPGFDWRIVLVESPDDLVTFVPDGTIFLSNGLVGKLSDDELAAVIAHFMGHGAYGDDRNTWTELGTGEKIGMVVAGGIVVAAMFPFWPALAAAGARPPDHIGYTEQQEIDADYMAVGFLAAADIAPDKLFDAMVKLSSPVCKSPQDANGLVDFNAYHHAQRNAEDLGKLLDAGLIPSPRERDGAATNVAHRETL
jgi:Peptidase family M48